MHSKPHATLFRRIQVQESIEIAERKHLQASGDLLGDFKRLDTKTRHSQAGVSRALTHLHQGTPVHHNQCKCKLSQKTNVGCSTGLEGSSEALFMQYGTQATTGERMVRVLLPHLSNIPMLSPFAVRCEQITQRTQDDLY